MDYIALANLATSQKTFEQNALMAKLLEWKNKNSNFHNFLLGVQNNPYTFLNLRQLYKLEEKSSERIVRTSVFFPRVDHSQTGP